MSNLQRQIHRSGDRKRHPMYWLALVAILLIALWIRIDDLRAWKAQPHRAFHNGRPILINFDGYFYLSLARDLLENEYKPIDTLRGVPEPQRRPIPPPLISLFAAAIAFVSPFSLDWIAALLPVFLGVLLAVPLYLFSRLYGGWLMVIVTVSVGLFSRYYVYRSNAGWFDTDCLNATFAFMVTYLFLRFGITANLRRYCYLVGGVLASLLFFLWWDQTRSSVILLSLCPLAMVLVLFYRPEGKERWLAIGIAVAILAGLLMWQGVLLIRLPVEKTMIALGYITETQVGDFPNTAQSVMEQKRPDLQSLAQISTGNIATFIGGISGLVWLLFCHRRQAIPLLALFGLGCFSLLFARRFTIFLNPFLAIGLGFAFQQLWDLRSKWPFLRYAAPLGAALVCLIAAKDSFQRTYWPKEIPPIIKGQDLLNESTAADALVWAWWDHGYPLRYWSQRATINDGSLHNGPRTVSNAIPLSSSNQRQAANFMYFYAVRGVKGLRTVMDQSDAPAEGLQVMKRVFAAGPENAESVLVASGLAPIDQWHRFFFPPRKRDIYLFLDLRVARTAFWWHWFGTWDTATRQGVHGKFQLHRNCRLDGGRLQGPGVSVDLVQGIAVVGQHQMLLSRFYHNNGRRVEHIDYPRSRGLVFAYHAASHIGALMDQDFSRTLFNQLYMLGKSDRRYFSLHSQHFPFYQIWRVSPDAVRSKKHIE
jgi:dolichyl-diphosphooligosaccharide--protein glycosyltransferase